MKYSFFNVYNKKDVKSERSVFYIIQHTFSKIYKEIYQSQIYYFIYHFSFVFCVACCYVVN